MKKLLLIIIILAFGTSIRSFSQVLSNQNVVSAIADENPFMDASTNFGDLNDNRGKGLAFPQTDLTSFTFKTESMDGITFPTAFDGMIVYNVASGQTISGQGIVVSVAPGFYFFSNPDGVNTFSITGGKWIRIASGNDVSSTASGTAFPITPSPKAGDVFYRTDSGEYYYYNGTDAWVSVTPSASGTPVIAQNGISSTNVQSALEDLHGEIVSATADGTVTLAKMAPLTGYSLIGNNGSTIASPQALTPNQVKSMLAVNVDELANVSISGKSPMDIMQWDGNFWVNKTLEGAGALTSETDPLFNASAARNITLAGSGAVITTVERAKLETIATGAEVNVNSDWNAGSGDAHILNKPTTLSGYGITDAALATHNHAVDGLSNVTITGKVNNDILQWDGTAWVNRSVSAAGALIAETDPSFTTSAARSITDAGSGVVITIAERAKLATITSGAEVNVNADWNASSGEAQVLNKPTAISDFALDANAQNITNLADPATNQQAATKGYVDNSIGISKSGGRYYAKPPRVHPVASTIAWLNDDTQIVLQSGHSGTINLPDATLPINVFRLIGITNASGASRSIANTAGGSTGIYTDDGFTSLASTSVTWFVSDGISWRRFNSR